jgi:hypothetical protein
MWAINKNSVSTCKKAFHRCPYSVVWAWCITAIVSFAGYLQTIGADFSDPEYLIDFWEIEDGLPDNSATSMVQASDGYLWSGFSFTDMATKKAGIGFAVVATSNNTSVRRKQEII